MVRPHPSGFFYQCKPFCFIQPLVPWPGVRWWCSCKGLIVFPPYNTKMCSPPAHSRKIRTYQLSQDFLIEGGILIMHQTILSLSNWHTHSTIYLRNFPYEKNRKNIRHKTEWQTTSYLQSRIILACEVADRSKQCGG